MMFRSLLILLLSAVTVRAELSLPPLFGDHMVLQQGQRNTVWGWGEPGEEVVVFGSWGARERTTVDADGRWKVFLETPEAGTGHFLRVRGQNRLQFENVAIGEVWLCAGQSNMGWAVGNTFSAESEANAEPLPDFRIFRSSREHWHEPREKSLDRLANWAPCTPEEAALTSAVSYHFGRKLQQELGVPVGIVVQAYAGTPIEGWMPWEIQQDDPRAQAHKAELDASAERQIERQGKTRESAMKGFEEELAEYNRLIDAGETMLNATRELKPPMITQPAMLGHQYPSNIFNAMIFPVRPYGIRGMVWYQGERNSKNVPQALHLRQQLPLMIEYFRTSWHNLSGGNNDGHFPFFFTQLPSWNPPQEVPVEGLEASWAVSRDTMRLVTEECSNTGMAVSIDTGDAVQLHPKNKKPIGLRHAYLALQKVYGRPIVGTGPRFLHAEPKGKELVLHFDSIGGGLTGARKGPLDAFAIAGEDQKWEWAEARIDGDRIVLSSPAVKQPVAARYAWAMNPSQRNLLYNTEGLPASPFRTDDWPLFDPDAELVEVLKPKKPEGYIDEDWERPEMTQ